MKSIITILILISTISISYAQPLLPHQTKFIDQYKHSMYNRKSLILAICGVESNFGRYTNGNIHDIGVMQMRLPAARDSINHLGVKDISDDVLIYYLRNDIPMSLLLADLYMERLFKHYGDINKAILAYNRGMSNVLKNPNIDPNNYVKKVNDMKKRIDIYLNIK